MIEFIKSLAITPLAFVWEHLYRLRRYLYGIGLIKKFFFQIPIISVGNIALGGTGKTPFTTWLIELANKYLLCPVVLTRGYKGIYEHSYGLVEGKKSFKYNPVDFGDEPMTIARRLQAGAIIVGKRRCENLLFFFNKLRPDVGILDDGFQYLRLFRNLDIVLFDALMPISHYQVPPKGYLREGVTSLKDADAIIISRCNYVREYEIKKLEQFLGQYTSPRAIWSHIMYHCTGLYDSNFKKVFETTELKGKKVIAAVAIASPQSFFKQLDELGAEVIEKVEYPDHYYFTAEDIQELVKKSKRHDAMIVTSEKDIVKIRKVSTEIKAYYLEIEIRFLKGEKELLQLINKVLKQKER